MIDFRSDTVTQPTQEMREVMRNAAVGDDVFGDDPTVNALQERIATLFQKEAALLFPSGTQSNLCALLAHCGRGDEYLVGQEYHTYRYEAGGAAALGGIVPQTIELQTDGSFSLALLQQRIKPDDPHFPVSRLLALENTHTGKVIDQDWIESACRLAKSQGLLTHLDGARIFNASVASGTSVAALTSPFDSVSVCFSKGLGCPMGSVLIGDKAFIRRALRWRKMVGGGMRQAGIIAAAMDYSLTHHIERLAQDHEHAQLLAQALEHLPKVNIEFCETNMVYVRFGSEQDAADCALFLKQQNILIPMQGIRKRFVTHLNLTSEDIQRMINAFTTWCNK
ncbi:low-specificity L-threonine aldolase [Aliidiomarina celeris]|uniref:low-specificity L-threonine aldolase n=1 Tax=Aliidiomarina celeris TaxID=2249428 RepID=UPI000DEAB1E9|nr:low-specificity L-threonine aldolase [Aliidiomarina celeris]